jgi:serine protease Do
MRHAPPALAPWPEINLRRTVITDIVARTKDAVVNISATKVVTQHFSPFGNDPFWQQFDFGRDFTRSMKTNSLGSGFIIHPDGYVVTNNHVIDRAQQIQVELADGRKLPADLISADAEADLAILKIAPEAGKGNAAKPYPVLELGDSGDLMIGEPVIAVGNPLGFSHSVTTGIVSAIHRDLKDDDGKVMLGDLVQTDAAINPGNSGGPLLNAYGQVIGINTAIRGDAQNMGFAIQVNKLRDLIPELMDPAHVHAVDLPLKLVEARRLTPPATVDCWIYKANGKTPIETINGQRPRNIVDAYAILLRVKTTDKVLIEYARGSKVEAETIVARTIPAIVKTKERLGITVEAVTPLLAEKYGLSAQDGLLITQVLKNSPAGRTGLKPGDIITQLGRYRCSTMADLDALLQRLPDKGKVRIGIIRAGQMGYGTLEL